MKLDNYSIVPVGSAPTFFNCSASTDPNSLCHSGFSRDQAAREAEAGR